MHRRRADGKLCDFALKLNQDKFNSEVEDVIRYMVREGRFREYMKNKLDEQAAYEKQITGKNVYQFLLDFDTLYERMTDALSARLS